MTSPSSVEFPGGWVARLEADDYRDVKEAGIGPWHVVVGRRANFRLGWMATTLHTFAVVARVDEITEPVAREFEEQVTKYARANKPGMPVGFQNGIAAVSILISPTVDAAARGWAQSSPRKRFAVMHIPAVVDTSMNEAFTYRGRIVIGGIYSKFLRERQGVLLGPDAAGQGQQ